MNHHEFTLTHVFNAPRDLLWRAWTESQQLSRWWGPEGLHTPLNTIEMDVRPGGVFRLTMVLDVDGTEFPSAMAFREVAEPERLVFGWEAQRGLGAGEVTITFTDLGDKTEMTTHFAGEATDEVAEQAQAGWAQQLGKLENHLSNQ